MKGYIVVDDQWFLRKRYEDGVLWRMSDGETPTVFRSAANARAAIGKASRFVEREKYHGEPWQCEKWHVLKFVDDSKEEE